MPVAEVPCLCCALVSFGYRLVRVYIYVCAVGVCVLKMVLPSLRVLLQCSVMDEEQRVLRLHAGDSLIVFMMDLCPDSQEVRDMLRAVGFTAENGRVKYVDVRQGGRMRSTEFSSLGDVYPSFNEDNYASMKKEFGTVLPKIFRVSVGGQVDPTWYYRHHKTGLEKITLS